MDDLEMKKTLKSSAGQLVLGRSHDHHHVATVHDEEFAKTCDNDAKDVADTTKENNSMMSSPSSQQEDFSHITKQIIDRSRNEFDEDKLESTKAEISEMKEENEKLKTTLARIMKDYQSLQSHISHNIVQQEQSIEKSTHTATCSSTHEEIEEPGFVSLSLGRTTSSTTETLKDIKNISSSSIGKAKEIIDQEFKQSLSLGLNCKLEVMSKPNLSSENSFDDTKEENQEQWQMSTKDVNKSTIRSRDDDEVSQQLSNPVKKPRVSVRTRCETPTMNDGCQWRKYGQKTAKGNPCPRAYYRCTVASACPVRKQVQRCAEDMSILITTYEGNHNHALPIAATAMASTTSAAASMLMSGSSSTSRLSLGQPSSTISSTTANNLHGVMNFNLSSGVLSKPFYLPNSTSSSISSSSTSHPTITLDLTTSSTTSASLLSSRSQHNFSTAPRYPSSTSFNFSSSSESNSTLPLPVNWNNNGGFLSYGSSSTTDLHQSYNKNQMGFYSLNHGKQTNQQQSEQVIYQPYTKNNNKVPSPPRPSSNLSGTTLEAATKAITSDPSFQSALASAIKSIVGGSGGTGGADHHHHQTTHGNQGGGSSTDHGHNNLKWGTSSSSTTTSTDPFSNIVPNLNFGQNFEQNSNGN